MMRQNNYSGSRVSRTQSEPRGARYRHDRFFYVLNEGWYLETRSGNIGPFSSHETAQHFLDTTYTRETRH